MGSLDSFKGEAVWEEETHPPNSPCRFQDERHQPRGVSWYPDQLEFGLLEAAAFKMTADPGSTFWPSHLFSIPTPWQVDSNPWAQIKSSFSSFSVQFSSVAQSCLILCELMNCSTPGLPVHHQLPEFTQTHVHRVSDASQPSHLLSFPSPPAPNPSQLLRNQV